MIGQALTALYAIAGHYASIPARRTGRPPFSSPAVRATRAGDLSRKLTAVAIGRAGGRRSCGNLRPEEDLVSEIVEAMDEIGRGALACLLVEKSLSEFLEGNRLAQHMEHSNQDLVRDGHGGAQRAPAGLQPVVL